MKKITGALVLVVLLALAARVVWWSMEPALPYLLIGFLLIIIYSAIFRRKW